VFKNEAFSENKPKETITDTNKKLRLKNVKIYNVNLYKVTTQ